MEIITLIENDKPRGKMYLFAEVVLSLLNDKLKKMKTGSSFTF